MANDPTKGEAEADAIVDPLQTSEVAKPRVRLKDRIADLQLATKATAARASIADRMKAVHEATPAAAEIKDRLKGAAAAVRLDKINRDTFKAGRDGLAAKVEALLKPRQVAAPDADAPHRRPTPTRDQGATDRAATRTPPPLVSADPATTVAADKLTDVPPPSTGRRDVSAMRARVEDALKSPTSIAGDTSVATPPSSAPLTRTSALTTDMLQSLAQTISPNRETSPHELQPATGRMATIKNRLTARKAIDETPLPTRETDIGPPAAATPARDVPSETVDPATVRSRGIETVRIVKAEADAERSRPIFSLGLLATAMTAGGILHILTTFMVPWFNVGSAFERLRWQLEPNAMRVFAADANGQTPLPFLTADMRYAMCRYDLTSAPVQVTAQLPDIGWSLALYTPQGDNFYAVPGQDGRIVAAQFTLNTASDRLLLPVPGVRRSDTDAAQVTSPAREGLIVLRAPNLGPAQQAAVDDVLKRATCRAVPRR